MKNYVNLYLDLNIFLNLWKSRKLTLFGKIQTLETFGISKFTYLCSSIVILNNILKEIEHA